MNDLAAFARLVDALRPWGASLVVVGGWAHRLHRWHPLADPPVYLPLTTRDTDLAFSPTSPLPGDVAAALAAAGFREELSGEHRPPVSRYSLGREAGGFYAEFVAPLHGSGIKRSGEPDATVSRAGVTAQKLRHVDLLLVRPVAMRLSRALGVPLLRPAEVCVANPVTFIAQRLLIQKERAPAKRPQDVLYIHDTLELFGRSLDALSEVWREDVRPLLPRATAETVERLSRDRFRTLTDPIRTAARIPQDRTLVPEQVRAVCAQGLGEIFGHGETRPPRP